METSLPSTITRASFSGFRWVRPHSSSPATPRAISASTRNPVGGLHLRLLNELAEAGNPNYGQNLRAQVLKVAHHGSNDGTSAPWLDAVRPDIALLSYKAGYPNGGSYGYPHPETVELLNARGIPGYQTTYHGHILVATDGNNIAVLTQNRHGTRLYPGRSWSSLSSSPSGPTAESAGIQAPGDGCEVPYPQGG